MSTPHSRPRDESHTFHPQRSKRWVVVAQFCPNTAHVSIHHGKINPKYFIPQVTAVFI